MAFTIPNEDRYWERRREEWESWGRRYPPEPERDTLFIDEEVDDLEAEYGCRMSELGEGDLMEILDRLLKTPVEYITAKWDERFCGIDYTYPADVGEF